MNSIKYISYADWLELVARVKEGGLACQEFDELASVYPNSVGDSYSVLIYNQLAKMEEYILKETLSIFEKQISVCLSEIDLETMELAFSRLRKHYRKCMFFLCIPDYPIQVKDKMAEEIKKSVSLFADSFLKYLKKIEGDDNSAFIQDFVYVSRKKMNQIKKMY